VKLKGSQSVRTYQRRKIFIIGRNETNSMCSTVSFLHTVTQFIKIVCLEGISRRSSYILVLIHASEHSGRTLLVVMSKIALLYYNETFTGQRIQIFIDCRNKFDKMFIFAVGIACVTVFSSDSKPNTLNAMYDPQVGSWLVSLWE